jgi:hypothetical protein
VLKKDGSLTTQQLIKKNLQDTEEKIKIGEILSGDLTLHRLMRLESANEYAKLDILTMRSCLNAYQRALEMLIQKERPRRMAVKLWARQIQGTASSNLSISVFPQCQLDVPNSTFPNQLTIGDWIKSVIAYERVEEYEITAQLLNDMREFTMSMQLKHTPEFKALHFTSEGD